MSRRIIQEINAGSMADIAFLLLIFFLVTTTMSTDMGLMRKLPPMINDVTTTKVKKRNLLEIWVNHDNKIMLRGQPVELTQLRNKAKEFIENKDLSDDLPEHSIASIPIVGPYSVTKDHLISLQSDRGTSYKTYITVQNELTAAYNDLRNEFAMQTWGENYEDLTGDKKAAADEVYPMHISEADPKQ